MTRLIILAFLCLACTSCRTIKSGIRAEQTDLTRRIMKEDLDQMVDARLMELLTDKGPWALVTLLTVLSGGLAVKRNMKPGEQKA